MTGQLKLHQGQSRPRNPGWRRSDARPWDGAFMEPRGCNWWQSTANRTGAEAPKQAKTVAVLCDRLPREVGVRDERPGDAAVRRARRASTNAPPAAAALAGLTIKKCDPENWSIALRIAFDLTM